jgi:ParB family transcriptional regulator, chromosome partitioning protein
MNIATGPNGQNTKRTPYDAMLLGLDEIIVPPNRRAIDKDTVRVIADSIKRIGLQQPISVRPAGNKQYLLVTGAHRLEAVRSLGSHMILSSIVKFNEIDARLWEISENLHRADLSKLERSEQIAEWATLTESKADVSRQVDAKPSGGGRPEGGVRAASRELGISEPEVRRSNKIASIAPEAKQASIDAGLDDNQSALLRVAAAPAEKQVEAVAKIVAAKAAGKISAPDVVAQPTATRDLAKAVNGFFRQGIDFVDRFGPRLTEWIVAHPELNKEGRASLHSLIDMCDSECARIHRAIDSVEIDSNLLRAA